MGIAYGEQARLWKFQLTRVVPGLSGGPVFIKETYTVNGIVKQSINPNYDAGGNYIPIKEAFTAFPELEEENLKYHLQDEGWNDAVLLDKAQSKLTFPFNFPNKRDLQSIGKEKPL